MNSLFQHLRKNGGKNITKVGGFTCFFPRIRSDLIFELRSDPCIYMMMMAIVTLSHPFPSVSQKKTHSAIRVLMEIKKSLHISGVQSTSIIEVFC